MPKKPAPAPKKAAAKKVPAEKTTKAKAAKPVELPAEKLMRKSRPVLTQRQGPHMLTPNEERFVEEYLIDLNGTQAYMRVFPHVTVGSARVLACRLLADVNLIEAIAAAKAERSKQANINAQDALQEIWGIATADTRELVEHLVGCCRHCWGINHRYQRTAAEQEREEDEYSRKAELAVEEGKPIGADFDTKGGIGYDKRKAPNPDCPECFGEGVGRTVFKDTRRLSRGAAALYAGVKETKDGLQVLTHNKGEALEKVAKHLGLYEKDNKQKGLLDGVSRDILKAVAERLRDKAG